MSSAFCRLAPAGAPSWQHASRAPNLLLHRPHLAWRRAGHCSRSTARASVAATPEPAPEPDRAQPTSWPPLRVIKELLKKYDAALKTTPIVCKALTSFVGFAIGDWLAQTGIEGLPFNPLRCLRLSLYGLLIDGPIGHAWYQLLDRHVYPDAPTSNRAVLAKTAADQLLWAPGMTIVFFAFLKVLEGRPDQILATIQSKLLKTVIANYLCWPLAHLINFKYVPTDYRILFNNVVSIAWTTYLSWLTCGTPVGARCKPVPSTA